MERERAHFEHVLKMETTMRRGDDIGVAGEAELLPSLLVHLEAWTSAEYHIRNAYLKDRLEIFLARNERARDLLRLPENRELALRVKKEMYWLHLPD